jgi:hypothetical protein
MILHQNPAREPLFVENGVHRADIDAYLAIIAEVGVDIRFPIDE